MPTNNKHLTENNAEAFSNIAFGHKVTTTHSQNGYMS
jgi:hypothetical protein